MQELGSVVEFKVESEDMWELYNNVIEDYYRAIETDYWFNSAETETDLETFDDIETDIVKQILQSAPMHKINFVVVDRQFHNYRKCLYNLYNSTKDKNPKIVEEIVAVKFEGVVKTENGHKRVDRVIKKTKIEDPRREFFNKLIELTTNADEQYVLLHYYCWTKNDREKTVKPHKTLAPEKEQKAKQIINEILTLANNGKSIRDIQKHLEQKYNIKLSTSTIHNVIKYKKASKRLINKLIKTANF